MNCRDARVRFLERLHGASPAAPDAAALELHLVECAPCAAWGARQSALDRALAAELAPPALPAAWRERLHDCVVLAEAGWAACSIADRRRAMEREYQERLGQMHGRLAPRAWGLFLAYGAAIALSCLAVHSVLSSDLPSYPGAEAAVMSLLAGAIALLGWLGAREARRCAFV